MSEISGLTAIDSVTFACIQDENGILFIYVISKNEIKKQFVTGRANLQKYWQDFIDAGLVDGSVSTFATGSNGDLGYEIGTAELKNIGKDGKISTEKIKYTELLKRNAEGKWISIYGMWNQTPESTSSTEKK